MPTAREYHELRHRIAPVADEALRHFEAFCQAARSAAGEMEWSWKLTPEHVVANRAFWLGRGGRRAQTAAAVEQLLTALHSRVDSRGGLPRTLELLRRHTQRALVAWSGPDPLHGRGPVLKLYLTLDPLPPERLAPVLADWVPASPLVPPPQTAGVLLALTLFLDGRTAPRVYVMLDRAELASPATRAWLAPHISPATLPILRRYRRFGIGWKSDTTDMVGLAPAATGATERVPLFHYEEFGMLARAAERAPELLPRLDRLSWYTLPIEEAAPPPLEPSELNLYVRLR